MLALRAEALVIGSIPQLSRSSDAVRRTREGQRDYERTNRVLEAFGLAVCEGSWRWIDCRHASDSPPGAGSGRRRTLVVSEVE
jgi:hypothetical protein